MPEFEALVCPGGRLHEGDLVADSPGSGGDGVALYKNLYIITVAV
ncbi:MAG: hypothetical protein V3S33_05740 [Gammaproteobacteria bacterium]